MGLIGQAYKSYESHKSYESYKSYSWHSIPNRSCDHQGVNFGDHRQGHARAEHDAHAFNAPQKSAEQRPQSLAQSLAQTQITHRARAAAAVEAGKLRHQRAPRRAEGRFAHRVNHAARRHSGEGREEEEHRGRKCVGRAAHHQHQLTADVVRQPSERRAGNDREERRDHVNQSRLRRAQFGVFRGQQREEVADHQRRARDQKSKNRDRKNRRPFAILYFIRNGRSVLILAGLIFRLVQIPGDSKKRRERQRERDEKDRRIIFDRQRQQKAAQRLAQRTGGHLGRRIPREGRSHRLLLRVLGDQRADRRVAQRFGEAVEKPDRVNLPRSRRKRQQQRDHAAQRDRHRQRSLQPRAVRDPSHQGLKHLLGDQIERKQKPGLSQTQSQTFVREDRQRKADDAETQPRQKTFGPDHEERRGDGVTERRGDGATGRRGDGNHANLALRLSVPLSLRLSVVPSPRRPVASSLFPSVSHYFKQEASA